MSSALIQEELKMYIESSNKTAVNITKSKRRIVSLFLIAGIIICLFYIKLQRGQVRLLKESFNNVQKNSLTREKFKKETREIKKKLEVERRNVKNLRKTKNEQLGNLRKKEEEINRLKKQIARLNKQTQYGSETRPDNNITTIPEKRIKGERKVVFNKSIPINKKYINSLIFRYRENHKLEVSFKLLNKSSQEIRGYGYIIFLYDKERKKTGEIRDNSPWSIFTLKNKLRPGQGKIKTFVVSVKKKPVYFTIYIKK
jgi:hypothetical protein